VAAACGRRRDTPGAAPAALLALLALLACPGGAMAQQPKQAPQPSVDWQQGPTRVAVGAMGQIEIPDGYIYAGQADTIKLLESMGNPTSGKELGLLAPKGKADWFIVYEFSDIGYIKDAEQEDLDADDLLESIRKGTAEANKIRKQKGWPALLIDGWLKPPHFDPATKNLQWAIKGTSEGKPVVNFNTRVLGRRGVMEVNLVTGPETLEATLPVFKDLLAKYSFKSGETYAEYKPGDKIAKYGLAALITGVGVAAALKTGLLARFWKVIVVVLVAIGAFFKKIFRAIFGRKEQAVVQRPRPGQPYAAGEADEGDDDDDEGGGGGGGWPPQRG